MLLIACDCCEELNLPERVVASQCYEGSTICTECAKTENQWMPVEEENDND